MAWIIGLTGMMIAYATKVLKELHESQVVAGKVAGMNTCPLNGIFVGNFSH